MRYKFDHDLHIHSHLSICSNDKDQTAQNILKYAKENKLSKICLTDHYWDSTISCYYGDSTKTPCDGANFYKSQNYDYVSSSLPLPTDKDVCFLFGCETELDKNSTIGIPKSRFNDFEFIIIPTTHLHFIEHDFVKGVDPNQVRANLWVKRLDDVLNMDLPFNKTGIAHLACNCICWKDTENRIKTLNLIPEREMERLFNKASNLGVGIEINSSDMNFPTNGEDAILRIFKIAKSQGCKFYLGSDAHHPKDLANAKDIFERAITLLGLEEKDKFYIK